MRNRAASISTAHRTELFHGMVMTLCCALLMVAILPALQLIDHIVRSTGRADMQPVTAIALIASLMALVQIRRIQRIR
jgi:hypothetical protein